MGNEAATTNIKTVPAAIKFKSLFVIVLNESGEPDRVNLEDSHDHLRWLVLNPRILQRVLATVEAPTYI